MDAATAHGLVRLIMQHGLAIVARTRLCLPMRPRRRFRRRGYERDKGGRGSVPAARGKGPSLANTTIAV